ncbi:acyl-CoA synthetase [Mycolicibacterium agri]|uniref:Acyl-CoA synthetase n=1 Tax=Mycolicibacterium agri TaxID=36811 RepID=A0A2A7MPF9_MYCAG|nr:fatty-acid--CoA ligase FadD1 [Mycolicibacterium agri]PEG33615.1 acyl-CoA synthetase [Mycolicibacterium agri]GFG51426.1 acyl-CoA synthetase [Mycolicibacterium agri]
MADTLQQLLRERAEQDTVAIKYGDRTWTWREHVAEAQTHAAAIIDIADHTRPVHVGVLLANGPEMLTAMAAAALGGYVLCCVNNTRRGSGLVRDIALVDCQILITDAAHRHLLDGLDLPGVNILDTSSEEWAALMAHPRELMPHREVGPDDTFVMIFTSGTSGDPKAVQVQHMMPIFSGSALAQRYSVNESDVCYVSMPLFHSNSIYAGWGVALVSGAAVVPAVFSASRFLDDIRRYGATYMNYVGKPLAYILSTPEQPDDHDNPLRVAFGNEASDRDIAEFARRFDCTVWDGFGSTENAVIITREDGCPPGSLGKGFPGVAIYNPDTLQECEFARFDDSGNLLNRDAAVGELVNTTGGGLFRGYYKDAGATDERLRHGMYWSGDLAYRDADGWIYFAGRTADWMRVDGENLAAAPIERVLIRLAQISRVAVYPVPDESVGDQVMAAIVLRDGATLTPEEFEEFLAGQADLSPKAWPRYVWITDDLPSTATNKILKRELVNYGTTPPGGVLWKRDGSRFEPHSRRVVSGTDR